MIPDIDFKKVKLSMQPQVLAGLMNLQENTDKNFIDLDRMIKSDQNMTALILKAANSSLYSRGQEVKTLQHAIAMMGFRVVRSLAMVASSQSLFGSANYSRFKRLVWHHSVATAVISRRLCMKLENKALEEESFIAGLLHDIGKVILNTIDRKKFIEVINKATNDDIPFSLAEKKVFGYTHLEAGERAVEEWKMPSSYRAIICGHGNIKNFDSSNFSDGDKSLLLIVAYANFLAKKYGYGHRTASDDKEGEFIRSELNLNDELVSFFQSEFPKLINNDEFYKFFMTLV